jgi:hypothetical protein
MKNKSRQNIIENEDEIPLIVDDGYNAGIFQGGGDDAQDNGKNESFCQ